MNIEVSWRMLGSEDNSPRALFLSSNFYFKMRISFASIEVIMCMVSAYGTLFFDYFPTNVLQEFLKRVIPDCLTGTLTSFLLDRQIETILINSSYVAQDGKG